MLHLFNISGVAVTHHHMSECLVHMCRAHSHLHRFRIENCCGFNKTHEQPNNLFRFISIGNRYTLTHVSVSNGLNTLAWLFIYRFIQLQFSFWIHHSMQSMYLQMLVHRRPHNEKRKNQFHAKQVTIVFICSAPKNTNSLFCPFQNA